MGPGQLATIWNWGKARPDGEAALVLTLSSASRRLAFEAPRHVRWRTPDELVVEQRVKDEHGSWGRQIARLTPEGRVVGLLGDRVDLRHAQPSPDGQWIMAERYDDDGIAGFEIWDCSKECVLASSVVLGRDSGVLSTMHPTWSPDSQRVAVSTDFPEGGRLTAGIALLDRDTPRLTELSRIQLDGLPQPEDVVPLFWSSTGIHVRSANAILRCDPMGSGCVVIYSMEKGRSAFRGVLVGDTRALLLVQDRKLDPFEVRAKEMHDLNLATGQAHVLLRLPAGVFISDVAWSGTTY